MKNLKAKVLATLTMSCMVVVFLGMTLFASAETTAKAATVSGGNVAATAVTPAKAPAAKAPSTSSKGYQPIYKLDAAGKGYWTLADGSTTTDLAVAAAAAKSAR